jgi:two-component sensor histidine kinase
LIDPFRDVIPASLLAQAIVDTIREPLLVLDSDLSVIAASRSFYLNFHVTAQNVRGRSIFGILDARFDIPTLHPLLKAVATTHADIDSFEFEATFLTVGKRTLILDAREVFDEGKGRRAILVAFQDVTDRRAIEIQKEELSRQTNELLRQKDVLLAEIQHRVANSLQIIASILMMKARLATSAEIREHLEDAHRRVLSVATVQEHIFAAGRVDTIEIRPYLLKLCESLAASMIGDRASVALLVRADHGTVVSADAVSVGLIVTELVINSLKHAFPKGHVDPEVVVTYQKSGTNWRLVVSDNGVGDASESGVPKKSGLGTSLVAALAHQLGGQVESVSSPNGLKVSVTRATFDAQLSIAA